MNRHFLKEEETFFPVLNRHFERAIKKIGGDIRPAGGPVNVMLLEHKVMRTVIQNLEQTLKDGKKDEISRNLAQLASLIRSHIFREENILHVVAEVKLKREEKVKIAEKLKAYQGRGQ